MPYAPAGVKKGIKENMSSSELSWLYLIPNNNIMQKILK
jgi:hypothetical protein